MSLRIDPVVRGEPVLLTIDGCAVAAFAGETVAAALLAADKPVFRRDLAGHSRGLFCNMGTCSECFVTLHLSGGAFRRLRACLLPVADGLVVTTGLADG